MLNKNSLLALGTFIGTMIGAGVFGIPYIFSKSGVLVCFFYLFILLFISLFLNLFFGETVLRTKQKHRLVGYAEKYLGKKAKIIATFCIIFGVIGSLVAYIILAGDFLNIVFNSLSSFQFAIIAWAFLSFFVFLGIRHIASAELLMNIGLFIAFILIFIFSFPKIETNNLFLANKTHLFLPFGVFLFSLIGWNAVPEVEKILIKKKNLKKIILFSLIFVAVFYFLFGLILSGVSGPNTTKEVFQGLSCYLGNKIIILGGIFGLFAVATSFLILANYLKNTLVFDYKVPYLLSFFIACFIPLFLYLLGVREFIKVVAFVGGFVGLIDGTLICLVYKKAKKKGERKPEYSLKLPNIFVYITIAVLVVGALTQLIYYLK